MKVVTAPLRDTLKAVTVGASDRTVLLTYSAGALEEAKPGHVT